MTKDVAAVSMRLVDADEIPHRHLVQHHRELPLRRLGSLEEQPLHLLAHVAIVSQNAVHSGRADVPVFEVRNVEAEPHEQVDVVARESDLLCLHQRENSVA